MQVVKKIHKITEKIKTRGIRKSIDEGCQRIATTIYGGSKTVRSVTGLFIISPVPSKWIFIVGCYNSGTTILKDLLSLHPKINTLPLEGVRYSNIFPRPESTGWSRMWIGNPESLSMHHIANERLAVKQLMKDWAPWWRGKGDVYLEKSITNITRMEWIERNFQNVYFVGITRDCYPVAEGIRRKGMPFGEAREVVGDRYSIEWGAKQWVDANSRLLVSRENVKKYIQTSYEELLEDPKVVLDRIYRFLEIDLPEIENTDSGICINGVEKKLFNGNEFSHKRLSLDDMSKIESISSDIRRTLGYT